MSRPRFCYLRVHVMLRREGWTINKKRVYRLYRLDGLQLRMKTKRRKRISLQRGHVTPATGPSQHWSMDFVHDQMLDGRKFRILTVIDQWSRECRSRARLQPHRALRRRHPRPGGDLARTTARDHRRRQRHRVHLQSARRVGLSTRRQARLHAAWKADRQWADRIVQPAAARRVRERARVHHDARPAGEDASVAG